MKFVHRLFLLILLLLTQVSTSKAENITMANWRSGDKCFRPVPKDLVGNQLLQSVFIVQALDENDEPISGYRGTATLLDNRGYFLTAAHVTEDESHLNNNNKWQPPTKQKFLLQSGTGDQWSLIAYEIVHGNARLGLDFSLLKAELPKPHKYLPLPTIDPLINYPNAVKNIQTIGYPIGEPHPFIRLISEIGPWNVDDGYIRLTAQQAFSGESGTLLIGEHGKSLGIMRESKMVDIADQIDVPIINFVPMFKARPLLAEIPQSAKIRSLLEALRLPRQNILSLHNRYRHLDLLALLHELNEHQKNYQSFIAPYTYDLYRLLARNGLCLDAKWIVDNFPSDAPDYDRMSISRQMLASAQTSKHENERQELANTAAKLMTAVLSKQDGQLNQNFSNAQKYWSRAYYDYALALNLAGNKDAETQGVIMQALSKSTQLDPEFANAYEFAGNLLQHQRKYKLAAAALNQAYQVGTEQKKLKREKDWTFIQTLSQSRQPADIEVRILGTQPDTIHMIAQSPALDSMGLSYISRNWREVAAF